MTLKIEGLERGSSCALELMPMQTGHKNAVWGNRSVSALGPHRLMTTTRDNGNYIWPSNISNVPLWVAGDLTQVLPKWTSNMGTLRRHNVECCIQIKL